MSVSLDGYFTGPDPGPGRGLGEGGEVLHEWLRQGTADRELSTRAAAVPRMPSPTSVEFVLALIEIA
jgi:hypothetical protein